MEPERHVRELVSRYGAIEVLHPVVSELLRSSHHKAIFERCLEQERKLLRSRSGHLGNHEITIIQKAFMILIENTEHHAGGVELYVEEILGLKMFAAEEKREALQTVVNTRNLVLNYSARDEQLAARWYETDYSQASEEELFVSPRAVIESPKDQHCPASVSNGKEDYVKLDSLQRVTLPAKAFNFDSDSKFNRLWGIFENVKEEFHSQPIDSRHRTKAAKFLRDTAENVLYYIKSNQPSAMATNDASNNEPQGLARKVSELRSSFNQAVQVAETGCGGKKRRFEYRKTDMPGELRKCQNKGSSQENVRHPEVTSRPQYPRRGRGSHMHYWRHRKVPISEKPPRQAGLHDASLRFDRPRFTDKYRPAYS